MRRSREVLFERKATKKSRLAAGEQSSPPSWNSRPKKRWQDGKEEPATKQVSKRGRSQGSAFAARMNLRAKDGKMEQQELGVLKGTGGQGCGSGIGNVYRSSVSPLFPCRQGSACKRNHGKNSAPASLPKTIGSHCPKHNTVKSPPLFCECQPFGSPEESAGLFAGSALMRCSIVSSSPTFNSSYAPGLRVNTPAMAAPQLDDDDDDAAILLLLQRKPVGRKIHSIPLMPSAHQTLFPPLPNISSSSSSSSSDDDD